MNTPLQTRSNGEEDDMDALGDVLMSPVVRQGLRGAYPCSHARIARFAHQAHSERGVSVSGSGVGLLSVWDMQYQDRQRWGDTVTVLLEEIARHVIHRDSQNDISVTIFSPSVNEVDHASSDSLPTVSEVYSYFMNHQHVLENRLSIVSTTTPSGVCGFLYRAAEKDSSYEILAFPSASYHAPQTMNIAHLSKSARAGYEVIVKDIFAKQNTDRIHFFIRRGNPNTHLAHHAN